MDGLDFGNLTDAQVTALLAGTEDGGTAPAAKVAPAAAPAVPEVKPAEEPALPAAHEDNGETKARISIKALKPEDRAKMVTAMEAIRSGGKSPAEAFAEQFGIALNPAAAPAPVAPLVAEPVVPAVAVVHPKVAELESKLATLQQEYQAAKKAFDPAKDDLLEQITDLKMDLRDARKDADVESQRTAAAAAQEQVFQTAQAESHARAKAKFSDLLTDPDANGDDGFITRCDYEIWLAEQKNDPIIQQADWPEKIGQKVFDKFYKGKEVQNPEPAVSKSQQIPPAPRQAVRLPGSPVGTGFAAGQLSQETAMVEFASLPAEMQIDILMKLDDSAPKRP